MADWRDRVPQVSSTPAGCSAGSALAGEAIDLASEIPVVVHSAVRLARLSGCQLEHAIPPHLSVKTDRRAFREAIAGVIAHAIGQTPGGRVLVTARRQPGLVQIGVTDDGPGGDAETQRAALHDPAALLTGQRGTLSIAPHPGQGTVVTLSLPDAASAAAAQNAAHAPERSLTAG